MIQFTPVVKPTPIGFSTMNTATSTAEVTLEDVRLTPGKADDHLFTMECVFRHVADIAKAIREQYTDADGTWIDKLSFKDVISIINQARTYVISGAEKCTGKTLSFDIKNQIIDLIFKAIGLEGF